MVIGISGVSRSGKSTLAERLSSHFKDKKCAIIHQDDYINSGYDIPPVNGRIDWEAPESIDFLRLRYDFIWLVENVDIVILEGIFAFYDKTINSRYDKKILIDLDYESFVQRKTKDSRWGDEPDWYIEHIWKSYEKQMPKIKEMGDLITLKGGENCFSELTRLLEIGLK